MGNHGTDLLSEFTQQDSVIEQSLLGDQDRLFTQTVAVPAISHLRGLLLGHGGENRRRPITLL